MTRAGFSLAELLIAVFVILVALPSLLETSRTVAQLDKTRDERSQATNLARLVLEQARQRLTEEDTRGYRLTDTPAQRVTAYTATPPAWVAPLDALAQPEGWVVATADPLRPQSPYFARLFARLNPAKVYPWAAADTSDRVLYDGLSAATNPELAVFLGQYRVTVNATLYDATADPDLVAKSPEAPKVDVSSVAVTVRWTSSQGRTLTQTATTRLDRGLVETDPTMGTGGGP